MVVACWSGFSASGYVMIMKFCPNFHCAAYGRVVYTQSTRCAFCRWDLKPPRMKSEENMGQAATSPVEKVVMSKVAADTRAHHKRAPLRRSA